MEEETKLFKQLLDTLPYLSEGEKVIACTLYFIADSSKRTQMREFYEAQRTTHDKALAEYKQKVAQAKKQVVEKNDTE